MKFTEMKIFEMGQKVKMVCGAYCSEIYGEIVNYEMSNKSKWFDQKLMAVINWHGADGDYTERVEAKKIKTEGNAIGVYAI